MSFYKFNTPTAIAAWDAMKLADSELRKQGTAFAELFGARPVFKKDVTSTSFHGIRFHGTTYVSASLWTQPTSNNGYCSWPKAKAPRGMSASHKALMELWNGCRPKQSVDVSAFYPAIGLDWGILFMTGFAMFRHADAIYIETGAKPKADAGAIEILGSEYNAAKREAK